MQVPIVPGRAHEKQGPSHFVVQQAPCAQKPLAHSASAEQDRRLRVAAGPVHARLSRRAIVRGGAEDVAGVRLRIAGVRQAGERLTLAGPRAVAAARRRSRASPSRKRRRRRSPRPRRGCTHLDRRRCRHVRSSLRPGRRRRRADRASLRKSVSRFRGDRGARRRRTARAGVLQQTPSAQFPSALFVRLQVRAPVPAQEPPCNVVPRSSWLSPDPAMQDSSRDRSVGRTGAPRGTSDGARGGAGLAAPLQAESQQTPSMQSARAARAARAGGAERSNYRVDGSVDAGITAALDGAAGARVAADRMSRATPPAPPSARRALLSQATGRRQRAEPATRTRCLGARATRARQARCSVGLARAMLSTMTVFASAASPHPISLTHLLSSRSL